ncbi:Lipase_3 domain-containing protein [Durusdinium trenchii]|uniref:Lipase_3 domain-containing protein n=1 Tax=Durusdinium trenchii TaxID=1381693 RepID=A0ABP0HCZ5_9DINO
MALNYHVGQLVVVRDDEEQNWHCARIYQTSPVLVKLRPRSSPSKYKFMKPLEALTEHEAKNVLALEQQLRNGMDLGPDPPPMGLTAEEQTAYPSIAAKANSSFLTVILLIGTLSPVILNNLWLMTANVVNEGDGHQHFWWYTLVFDNYFMIVKGLMFSAFFYAFLPEPAKGHRKWLYWLLAIMWPLFSFLIHMLWLAVNTVGSDDAWGLMKLNFPVGASAAVFAWMPLCLYGQYSREERFFATKRFVVIIVILVADLIFISSSHLVLLLFKAFGDGEFGAPDPLVRAIVELAFLLGFMQVYLPLLGKVWQIGLLLFDTLAPMKDLQRQRMLYFATVILDMHRYMYVREMMYATDSVTVVICMVFKDFVYDVYNFGMCSSPALQSAWLMGVPTWKLFLGASEVRVASSRIYETCIFVVKLLSDFLELPRCLTRVFTWTIDCGYPKHTSSKSFCFAETEVKLVNVPSDFGAEFKEWAYKTAKDRQQNRFILQSEDAHSSFDTVIARDAVEKSNGEWRKVWEGFRDPGLFSFYQFMTVQLSGIIFCRYRARIIIKIASSIMLLTTGTLIRLTPSKDVLNRVHDHSQPRELMQWIVPAAMLFFDVLELVLVQCLQDGDAATMGYKMKRFARLFNDPIFLGMVMSCHVCCNSDLYITFANLKFRP